MTTLKRKPPGNEDLLPTPEIPCMYVTKEEPSGLVDHCILSMFYIVKDADQPDDAERPHWLLVRGGVNMWMDNNCCGSFSISASQVAVSSIHPNPWTNPKDSAIHLSTAGQFDTREASLLDEDGNHLNSYNRICDPDKSPFLHVNTLLPDFPALTRGQALRWGRAVLLTNILGLGTMWSRTLMRSVDMVDGHQEAVLDELPSLEKSMTRAINPVCVSKHVLNLHPFTRDGSLEDERGIHTLGSFGIEYPSMLNMMCEWEMHRGVEVFNPNSGNEIRSTELLLTEDSAPSSGARDSFLPVRGMAGADFPSIFSRFHAAAKTPWVIANLRRDSWSYAH